MTADLNLSPLLKRLENLQRDVLYIKFIPLQQTIEMIKYDIEISRAIIKRQQNTEKEYLKNMGIDKDLKKSPQKQDIWNHLIPLAIKTLNSYCHDDTCQPTCKKTHKKAIVTIANLLKILYPSIWKENINTIANRIRQKDYRNLQI